MHDQWRVQSFLVPIGVDPGTLEYGVIGPEGQDQYALRTTTDRSYTDQNLLPNTAAGQPAVMPTVPAFTFVRFPVGLLPAGTYRLGIACTFFRETAMYWDAEMVITSSPDDEPAQFVWSVPSAPPGAESSGTDSAEASSNRWVLVVTGVAVVGLAGFFWQRRTRYVSVKPTLREPQ